jgi:N-acetylglucosamine kinase-like BadF-type ATPase
MRPKSMHVLGIDAGGTKTICYLADADAKLIGEGRAGGANLKAEGELAVEKVLHAVMDQALGGRRDDVAAICLGMAGADRDDEKALVRDVMRRIGARSRVVVVNDALVALVAGVGDAPGVVIVSGTGSIAYGRSGERAARAGGWGHVLGDEGGGYWIGRRALRAVARAADGRGPTTALTASVLAHFGVREPQQLIVEIYDRQLRHHALAQAARLVQQARDDGDAVAAGILERAADELVCAARSVVDQLQLRDERMHFVLAGGVFTGVPWLAEELRRRLPTLAPRAAVKRLEAEPALGAVRLALAEAAGSLRLPRYVS